MRQLDLALFPGPITEAPGATVVVLVPSDERPLGGDAGRVDWRLCGEVSHLLRSGYATGEPGEAIMLPGRGPLRDRRVLLCGAGAGRSLQGRGLGRLLRAAMGRLVSLRATDASLALPAAVDFATHADEVLRGLLLGLAAEADHTRLCIVLGVEPAAERRAEEAFERVARLAEDRGVAVTLGAVDAAALEAPLA